MHETTRGAGFGPRRRPRRRPIDDPALLVGGLAIAGVVGTVVVGSLLLAASGPTAPVERATRSPEPARPPTAAPTPDRFTPLDARIDAWVERRIEQLTEQAYLDMVEPDELARRVRRATYLGECARQALRRAELASFEAAGGREERERAFARLAELILADPATAGEREASGAHDVDYFRRVLERERTLPR